MPEFASEGFDLDALASATEDVVLELGGTTTTTTTTSCAVPETSAAAAVGTPLSPDAEASVEDVTPIISAAEAFKQQGNEAFQRKEWQRAHELYSDAIHATPGMTGAELLKLQKTWQDEQHQKVREELRQQDAEKLAQKKKAGDKNDGETTNTNNTEDDDDDSLPRPSERKERNTKFEAPPHSHGKELAVYYSNRAAASMQMAQEEDGPFAGPAVSRSAFDTEDDDAPPTNPRLQEAVEDCSLALLLQPDYAKALVRRSTTHERMGNTEAALQDAIAAASHNNNTAAIRATVARLQKMEDARIETLKTETLAKLKDLGNSILGNFGLSLDSFNAQKDPNTGSYSISFNQNK